MDGETSFSGTILTNASGLPPSFFFFFFPPTADGTAQLATAPVLPSSLFFPRIDRENRLVFSLPPLFFPFPQDAAQAAGQCPSASFPAFSRAAVRSDRKGMDSFFIFSFS